MNYQHFRFIVLSFIRSTAICLPPFAEKGKALRAKINGSSLTTDDSDEHGGRGRDCRKEAYQAQKGSPLCCSCAYSR
jgi:hypothetical protein